MLKQQDGHFRGRKGAGAAILEVVEDDSFKPNWYGKVEKELWHPTHFVGERGHSEPAMAVPDVSGEEVWLFTKEEWVEGQKPSHVYYPGASLVLSDTGYYEDWTLSTYEEDEEDLFG